MHNTILSGYAKMSKSFQVLFYQLGGFNRAPKSIGFTPLQKRARIERAQYQQRSFKRKYAARKVQRAYRKYATKKRIDRAKIQQKYYRNKQKKGYSRNRYAGTKPEKKYAKRWKPNSFKFV